MPDELPVTDLEPRVKERVKEVRSLLRDAVPEVEESITGSRLFYRVGTTPLCAVVPLRAWVTVGFFHGENLPDPEGLLAQGEGSARHLKLWMNRQVPTKALRELFHAAGSAIISGT